MLLSEGLTPEKKVFCLCFREVHMLVYLIFERLNTCVSLQDWDERLHSASGHNLFYGTDCTWEGEVPFLIRDVSMLSPAAFPVIPWLCAEMLWPMPVKKVCQDFFTSPPRAWHPRSRFTVPWLCLAWAVTRMVALAREMKTLSLGHFVVFRGMSQMAKGPHTAQQGYPETQGRNKRIYISPGRAIIFLPHFVKDFSLWIAFCHAR